MPDGNWTADKVPLKSTEVRGIRGSTFALATQAEIDGFVNELDAGIREEVSYENLVATIAKRFATVTGKYQAPERL